MNKSGTFSRNLHKRLRGFSIDCVAAIDCIARYDSEATFIYCDPPYIGTNCGHYRGFSESDYRNLLEVLSGVRGKFLLSGFSSAILREYVDGCGWSCIEIEMDSPAKRGKNTKSIARKIEVLVGNFPELNHCE